MWSLIFAFIIHPLDALALVPDSFALITLWSDEYAFAMLFSMRPLALVGTTVWVRVDTVAVLLIIEILTLVLAAVFPLVRAESVHVALAPKSLITPAVDPLVKSSARELILVPFADVLRAILPSVDAESMLPAITIHAFVLGIPLNVTDQNASPMVVWEESNIIIREYFAKFSIA